MEKVKSESKNIHAKRPLFFNIGLVLALVACFLAFEFKVYIPDSSRVDLPIDLSPTFLSEKIQPTVQKPKPKPEIPISKSAELVITETKETFVEPVDEMIDINTNELDELLNASAPALEIVVDPTIYDRVEREPQFEGGIEAFYKYLADNIVYPKRELQFGIDGRVYLQFVIEVDGSISDIQVIKGVSDGLDKEALRVLEAAPKWIPGANRGQEVRVRMTIPINFKLH